MKLQETLEKILDNAEKTLDKMTGETPKSREATKEKFRNFINKITSDSNKKEEKKDEINT